MNIAGIIYKELAKLGLSNMDLIDFQEIRNKDGVYLYRVIYDNKFYVLKYFLNDEYTREIENYSILKELNIPTVEVFGYTDRALLLEDIEKSKKYRLGVQSDLSDIEVAKALAKWYIKLHNEGEKYISGKDSKFYREIDVITKENIELIKNKSNTGDNKVWYLIIDNLDLIFRRIKDLGETMTYNDFYWTNLVVSNDKREAIMFDYNLLGIGFKYNDIRNVCSSLSEEAGKVFIEAYGGINQREKTVDDGISILVNLIFAYQRPMFPNWAQDSLGAIYNGKLEKAIKRILE
ncbi:MAG: hypothetical protein ACLKAK_11680, partial [Alkaliphilus sp.]